MEKPAPIPTPSPNNNIKKEDIKFINEYKLNFENIIYLLKLGKIENEIEELIIFVKDENKNTINTCYYQNSFSLKNIQQMNKIFRQFDTIDEIIDALKDIISDKQILIKKEKDDLLIIFKFKKLGKGEEEIIFTLKKNNIESGKIIENLISNINNIKLEIKELKNEINSKKIKKYHPVLENGWIVEPYISKEFIVCKNNESLVSFQGAVQGDWSKKIFTLEKEFRTKNRLFFPVIANQSFNRVDILPNGDIYMSFHGSLGVKGSGWVNLSGISYYICD